MFFKLEKNLKGTTNETKDDWLVNGSIMILIPFFDILIQWAWITNNQRKKTFYFRNKERLFIIFKELLWIILKTPTPKSQPYFMGAGRGICVQSSKQLTSNSNFGTQLFKVEAKRLHH